MGDVDEELALAGLGDDAVGELPVGGLEGAVRARGEAHLTWR
jgi:hypothetical protein